MQGNILPVSFILLTMAGCPDFLLAQQMPHFLTTLYFEDAVGNRDSIEFGFHDEATEAMDSEFGEYEVFQPFDSIFEVRGGTPGFIHRHELTKRLISGTSEVINDTCWGGSGGYLYVHAIHQPVKVWWHQNTFLSDICFRGAFIANHHLDGIAGPISPEDIPPLFYCMADVDTAYFDLTAEVLLSNIHHIEIEQEVEGLGLTTIYGLRLAVTPVWAYTPCFWVTNTRTPASHDVRVFPNPTSGELTLDLPAGQLPRQLVIREMTGQLVSTPSVMGREVDTSTLPPGMYLLSWNDERGDHYVGKFVKQ